MNTKNTVAVILPAYNEEQTAAATIEDFHQFLPDAQVWVVNNRSSDTTEQVARAALARLGCSGGVINEKRHCNGNAVRRAFLDIDADIYILADADMTYPVAQAQSFALKHGRENNPHVFYQRDGAVSFTALTVTDRKICLSSDNSLVY